MLTLAYGLNANSTLATTADSWLGRATDVTADLAVDAICWTGWGGTVGCDNRTDTFKSWGFAPSPLHPATPCPPTTLDLPVQPRAFIGVDSLDAFLGEDLTLYVPDENTGSWRPIEGDEEGWLSVVRMGNGTFVGVHKNDATYVVQAATLTALCASVPPSRSEPPVGAPSFAHLHAGSSHVLCSPTNRFHPVHALGSNLHGQLGRPISSEIVDQPVSIEALEGLDGLVVQTAGVYSLARSPEGQIWLWGGRFGPPSEPLDMDPFCDQDDNDGEDEDELYVKAASVGPTGAVLLALSDGRVVASGATEDELLPSIQMPSTRPSSDPEWQSLEGTQGVKGRVREVVLASGGRGWFLLYEDDP